MQKEAEIIRTSNNLNTTKMSNNEITPTGSPSMTITIFAIKWKFLSIETPRRQKSECAAKSQDKDAAEMQGRLVPLGNTKRAIKVCKAEVP